MYTQDLNTRMCWVDSGKTDKIKYREMNQTQFPNINTRQNFVRALPRNLQKGI